MTPTSAAPADTHSATPTPPNAPTPAFVPITRWLAVLGLLGLIGLGVGWEIFWAPLRPGSTWLAIKVLPLCIPLAGILKNRMYTYRWVSLVIWLYFIEGVVRGWGDKPPGNILGWIEVALCMVVFTACTLHVRLRLKHAHKMPT